MPVQEKPRVNNSFLHDLYAIKKNGAPVSPFLGGKGCANTNLARNTRSVIQSPDIQRVKAMYTDPQAEQKRIDGLNKKINHEIRQGNSDNIYKYFMRILPSNSPFSKFP